jgi:putative phosphoribosyl transferase
MLTEDKPRLFINRAMAGQLLATRLLHLKKENGIVLGIPRGGIPVACEIAKLLSWPLGAIWIKKIGHPYNPELAIGAASVDDIELNENAGTIPQDYIEERVKQIRTTFHEQQMYIPEHARNPDIRNKYIILVDDGIATGSTMLTAIRFLRKKIPFRIIVAIPVAPHDAVRHIEEMADEVIILHQPYFFTGISAFYDEFPQLSNDELGHYFKKNA